MNSGLHDLALTYLSGLLLSALLYYLCYDVSFWIKERDIFKVLNNERFMSCFFQKTEISQQMAQSVSATPGSSIKAYTKCGLVHVNCVDTHRAR